MFTTVFGLDLLDVINTLCWWTSACEYPIKKKKKKSTLISKQKNENKSSDFQYYYKQDCNIAGQLV